MIALGLYYKQINTDKKKLRQSIIILNLNFNRFRKHLKKHNHT